MIWHLEWLPEAQEDFDKLDGSLRTYIRKAIKKVSANPLPIERGGYGVPLRNTPFAKLAGFFKIKLRSSGIRIVYKLYEQDGKMLIVIIGVRDDSEVYNLADKRIKKYNL